MKNYVQKIESVDHSDNVSNSNEVEELAHNSCKALNKVLASLIPALLSGTGFTLSEVRANLNEVMHPNQIHNYQVKSFMIQKLGEGIKFCLSTWKNKSLTFCSANLSANDIARKVQSIEVIKDAAHILQKEIKACTFGLEKKHCDAFDLQDAWTNGKVKKNADTFLAALFNLNKTAIDIDDLNKQEIYLGDMILDCDDDSDDTDAEATETPSCRTITKSIRAYSIY